MSVIEPALDEMKLRALYAWVDKIPLSRPKRNISRDFADGVLLAEVVATYFPALVEIHNYGPANSFRQKMYNLETLNGKVLKKLGFQLTKKNMEDIVSCAPGAVEIVLYTLQMKMAKYEEEKTAKLMSSKRVHSIPKPSASVGAMSIGSTSIMEPARSLHQSAAILPVKRTEASKQSSLDSEILREKEQHIRDLQEQVVILELKVSKLEQLVRFKDNKIQKLQLQLPNH